MPWSCKGNRGVVGLGPTYGPNISNIGNGGGDGSDGSDGGGGGGIDVDFVDDDDEIFFFLLKLNNDFRLFMNLLDTPQLGIQYGCRYTTSLLSLSPSTPSQSTVAAATDVVDPC